MVRPGGRYARDGAGRRAGGADHDAPWPHGELTEQQLLRWSNLTADGSYDWGEFTARFDAEQDFGGYTIPSRVTAMWAAGTDREFAFFHADVHHAHFKP